MKNKGNSGLLQQYQTMVEIDLFWASEDVE